MKGGKIIYGDGLKQTQIGYLPQQTDVQKDFPASVGEVVLSGSEAEQPRDASVLYGGRPGKKLRRRWRCWESKDLAKQCFRDLSGGQKQRVLLARALCATKSMLLLDEPVTGLDPIVTAEFYQLIRRINRKSKIAVVMVSHDIESAVEDASHILHPAGVHAFLRKQQKIYRRSSVGRKFLGRGGADV